MIRPGGYRVLTKSSSERDKGSLPTKVFLKITKAILSLETSPRQRDSKKLRGRQVYRLRTGNYRILYTIDDASHTVEIIAVGHRKDVYRHR